MIEPTGFGKYLREKRRAANLTQNELAESIKKTGQYISNIEKGKNNAPPNGSDIEALICKLNLDDADARNFRRLAAADRNQLSSIQMAYLFQHKSLLALIDYGVENGINDSCWEKIFIMFTNSKSSSIGGEN